MKKHSSIFHAMTALLMVGLTFVSCTKESEPVSGKFSMSVNASKSTRATKNLSDNGTTLTATWKVGEEVKVYNGETLLGTLTATTAGSETKLTGEVTGTIAEGNTLTLKFCSPNYQNGQDGTLEYIAANCDYATASITVTNVTSESVTTSDASFTNQQAIVKFTLLDKANDANLNASILSVEVDGYVYAVIPASATNVFYVALPEISNKKVSLFAKTAAGWYSYGQAGVSFANGQYYTVGAKLAQTGMLPGVFSVDGSNTVHFSQGNLQRVSGTWQFASNQYDVLGSWSSTSCDLFYWETTGNYGSDKDCTTTSGSSSDVVNWGANAISNGGNVANQWGTLNKDKWNNLVNSTSKYGYATVCGQTGIILLPNNFTDPMTNGGSGVFVNGASTGFTSNVYTSGDNWNAMEAAGAVFLPAAGGRFGTDVTEVGTMGDYWSSTAHSNGEDAFEGVGFYEDEVYQSSFDWFLGRDNGISVRLVKAN